MRTAWNILEDAGVPMGPPRPHVDSALDPMKLQAALQQLGELHIQEREVLRAWLEAFVHHWPRQFERTVGDVGARWLQSLRDEPIDANRFLKLRRLAIAELARRV